MHIPAAFPVSLSNVVTSPEEDQSTLAIAPGIVTRPGDSVHPLREERMPLPGVSDCVARTYAVVHRRDGVHTHIYTVLESRHHQRRVVHLRQVLPGEQLATARAWMLAGRHLGRLGF